MNPDVTRTDKAYWNEVLKSHNLSMSRGNSKGVRSQTELIQEKLNDKDPK